MELTFFTGTVTDTDPAYAVTTDSLSDVQEAIRSAMVPDAGKGAAGYFTTCALTGKRSAENAQPTDLVALDCDVDGEPVRWADLAGLAYLAHTTDSHERVTEQNPTGGPRWRVFVLLDSPRDAASWPRSPWPWAKLRSIAQPVFVPTRPDVEWRTGGGARVSWPAASTAIVPLPVLDTAATPAQSTIDRFRHRWHDDPRDTNRLAGTLGAILASGGWTDAAIAAGFAAWFVHPAIARHTRSALAAAARRRAGERIFGYPEYEQLTGARWEWETPVDDLSWAEPVTAPTTEELIRAVGGTWVRGDGLVSGVRPPQWLVARLGLAPGRYCGLAGSGGVGKTWFAQGLALAVATGTSFCGLPVRRGPVLHIDHEQGVDMTKERYQLLGLRAACPDLEFVSFPRWRLSGQDGKTLLGRMAQGRALVIIDSLRASIEGDENASEVRRWLDNASDVSDRTGACVLVLHHARKQAPNAEVEDPYYEARGSSGITDAAGAFWVLKRGKRTGRGLREPDTLHQTKPGRHGEDDVVPSGTAFTRHRDGDRILLRLGESPELDADRAEASDRKFEQDLDRCLALLDTRPRSSSELARVLRISKENALAVTAHLIQGGQAERVGDGRSAVVRLIKEQSSESQP